MIDLYTKIPPQNLELEEACLSGCLLYPEICNEITDILDPMDFYKSAHQKIYQAILDLRFKKQPVDLITVMTDLKDKGILDETGGATYLSALTDVPIPASTEYIIQKLREYTILRKTIILCADTMQKCYDSSDTLEIIDNFQKDSLQIDTKITKETYSNMKELVEEGEDRHEMLYKNKNLISGIQSGFKDIDSVTCGFQNGDLIIIAARPGMGKSSLATNFSVNMAKAEYPNAIFSLEMTKGQLYDRMLSGESGINSTKFRSGYFSSDEWIIKNKVSGDLYDLPIFIEDEGCFKLRDITRKARRLKKLEDVKILIVDYLQLAEGDTSKKKNYEIADITKSLKILAKELSIPIILLSQLNRNCEARPDKRPLLSDLRDSGSIEQDADVVMFLYRHEEYIKNKFNSDGSKTEDFEKWEGMAELNVAKQRMGPTRRIKLTWLDKITTFRDYTDY